MSAPRPCPDWCQVDTAEHLLEAETVGGYVHRAELLGHDLPGHLEVVTEQDVDSTPAPDAARVVLHLTTDDLTPMQARALAAALTTAVEVVEQAD